MTSPNPNTGHFSPALLALKRFIRGPLRQAAIGVISLVIVLNFSTHAPASSAGMSSESSPFLSTHATIQENLSYPVQHLADDDASDDVSDKTLISDKTSLEQFNHRPSSQTHSAISPSPKHAIVAKMTHHRLTNAYLSIPTESERSSVSVAGNQ